MSKALKHSGAAAATSRTNSDDRPQPADSLEAILAQPLRAPASGSTEPEAIRGVVIGTLTGVAAAGIPQVDYPGSPATGPLAAVATEPVGTTDVGREVALSFIGGNPRQPLILGFICRPGEPQPSEAPESVDVKVDGETVTLTGKQQIVLSCGKASITLTRAGKIIIKGAYLSSRSSGVNRIKGGSVQIN